MRRTGHVAGIAAASFGVVVLLLLLGALPAKAEVHLDITRGKVEPLPIAIPDFAGGGGEESQTGSQIAGVVSADLDRSGLFRTLDPKSFIQNVSTGEQPRLLVLENPGAGIDPVTQESIRGLVRSFARDLGIGILLADHDHRKSTSFLSYASSHCCSRPKW